LGVCNGLRISRARGGRGVGKECLGVCSAPLLAALPCSLPLRPALQPRRVARHPSPRPRPGPARPRPHGPFPPPPTPGAAVRPGGGAQGPRPRKVGLVAGGQRLREQGGLGQGSGGRRGAVRGSAALGGGGRGGGRGREGWPRSWQQSGSGGRGWGEGGPGRRWGAVCACRGGQCPLSHPPPTPQPPDPSQLKPPRPPPPPQKPAQPPHPDARRRVGARAGAALPGPLLKGGLLRLCRRAAGEVHGVRDPRALRDRGGVCGERPL
jgi:hypothetical protein